MALGIATDGFSVPMHTTPRRLRDPVSSSLHLRLAPLAKGEFIHEFPLLCDSEVRLVQFNPTSLQLLNSGCQMRQPALAGCHPKATSMRRHSGIRGEPKG